MSSKKAIRDATGTAHPKGWKATLFQSERLLIGVNCLEPGQVQAVHEHASQDKFYLVHEGVGHFTVGLEIVTAAAGEVVWTPAGVPHGVENRGTTRLTVVVGIAPATKSG